MALLRYIGLFYVCIGLFSVRIGNLHVCELAKGNILIIIIIIITTIIIIIIIIIMIMILMIIIIIIIMMIILNMFKKV